MKKGFYFWCLLFLLSAQVLLAEDQIVSTLNEVDLIATDLLNDDGHDYGEKYFVLNRSDVPMRISIHLMESENAVDELIKYTIIVNPHDRIEIGSIFQDDLSQSAQWKYEWKTAKDIG